MRNLPDQVTSEHAGLAVIGRREISRQSVKVGSGAAAVIPRREAFGEEATDHACQDVAGSRGGHSRDCRSDKWLSRAIRSGNDRARAFEDHDGATFRANRMAVPRRSEFHRLGGRFGFESGHLSWVRGDDRRSPAPGSQQ